MNQSGNIMYMVVMPIEPYIIDVFKICALPNGFCTRTRYQDKWLDSSLLQQLNTLVSTEILILTYDSINDLYFPIRWGKLEQIDSVGGICRIEFSVDRFVRMDTGERVINEVICDFSKHLKKENHSFLGSPDIRMRKGVFLSKNNSGVEKYLNIKNSICDEVEAWGRITESLSHIDSFAGKEFINIVRCNSLNGDEVPVQNNRWVLKSNTLYEIKILQHIYEFKQIPQIVRHKAEITGPNNHISLFNSNTMIIGKYDYFSLKFKTNALGKKENSYISLLVDNDAIDPYNSYEIELPTLILPCPIIISRISFVLAVLFAIVLIINPILKIMPDSIIEVVRVLLIICSMSASDAVQFLVTR